jgi:PHD/YefM family antitoxin component YafN of YafNO toxin-antitoxin module
MGAVRIIGLEQAQSRLEAIMEQSARQRDRWIVQKGHTLLRVVISFEDFEDYEDLLETAGELSDPVYLASIRQARAEYKAGEVDTLEDLYQIAEGKG